MKNIIRESLSKSYEATVGKKFIQTLELKDFLERYRVELPTLSEAEQHLLNNEITMDELKDLCFQPRSVLLLAIQFPYTNFSLHKFQN
jgi:hypothetical protein